VEHNAEVDLYNNDVHLFTLIAPSEEQQLFAKDHSFMFEKWEGKNLIYKEPYNKIILDYLNKKFDKNIEEELRKICWRNHQL
jgi:predicted transglutaminase-like protease